MIVPSTTRAPTIAPASTANVPDRKNPPPPILPPRRSMTMATPSPAPEFTPKIEGPASGLLKAVCNMRPAVAREAPANNAVTACGKRDCRTIKLQLLFSTSFPRQMSITASRGIFTDPQARLARTSIKVRAVAKRRKVRGFMVVNDGNSGIFHPGKDLGGK